MRTTTWMLWLACVACGGPGGADEATHDSTEAGLLASALEAAPSHGFDVKSAAYDVSETGITRTFTLYVSDQNDVCADILQNRRHKNEHRLGMVGMAGGRTPLTSRYSLMNGRTAPRADTAMLVVPVFYDLDARCASSALHVTAGSMTVLDVKAKQANAAYNLTTGDGAEAVMGAVTAKYCRGLHAVRGGSRYATCID